MKEKRRPGPPELAEVVFDTAYLLFALVAGVIFLLSARWNGVITIFGVLTLTLGFGDAFHLVPRIYAQWTGTMEKHRKALGFGKLVTSVTMTLFYVMLYYIWQFYYGLKPAAGLTAVVLVLAAVRVVLCFFPQNGWFDAHPPLSWAIARNVPFTILGAVIVVLFAMTGGTGAGTFRFLPVAVTLSFLFYLIVVLFADKYKRLGIFMLPKTCMYIWVICMGFGLLK